MIQALALRPCAVLRGCGFKHIGSQKAEKRNRTNGSIVVVVVVIVVVVVALAVRNRSGIGPESSATVRQEAVKIQAKRNTRGPELVRKVLQRSEKKQSKYKLNATLAVRNRSGIGPERFATVRKEAFKIQAKPSLCGPESVRKALTWSESSQPLLVKEGEGKDSRFKRFRAVSDLFRTCFGLQSSGQY